jgi:hypothetical protein
MNPCVILSIGSIYIPKPVAIFNALGVILFFHQLMQVQVVLQCSACVATQDACLLCQFLLLLE